MRKNRKRSTIFQEDRGRVELAGRRAGSALRVHEALKARPILTLPAIRGATGLSFPAVSSGMEVLVSTGIARELTGRRRNRVFVYDRYLAILNEGTEVSEATHAHTAPGERPRS
ncbi:MAG: hypothetical protein ACREM1_23345 [Longimicrobiales bacterium]